VSNCPPVRSSQGCFRAVTHRIHLRALFPLIVIIIVLLFLLLLQSFLVGGTPLPVAPLVIIIVIIIVIIPPFAPLRLLLLFTRRFGVPGGQLCQSNKKGQDAMLRIQWFRHYETDALAQAPRSKSFIPNRRMQTVVTTVLSLT
jgi:hypothetical protein